MRKFVRLTGFFVVILSFTFILSGCDLLSQDSATDEEITREEAIASAIDLYLQKKAEGMDFSNGPCLSDDLLPGWVADIAHDPREDVDNQPENQCSAYREGRASHFVELDLEGNLIRAI